MTEERKKGITADWDDLVRVLIRESENTEPRPDLLPVLREEGEEEASPADSALREFREEYSKRVRAAHAN